MILWLALFALVIAISFVLALQSMRDFQESPKHFNTEYGLFLIRNTLGLTEQVLDSFHNQIIKDGLIISFERLFKGSKSALVIFGPKDILLAFQSKLNLLELEDYTVINKDHATAWEVGVKGGNIKIEETDNFFANFPALSQAEQFWWQLTLQAKNQKEGFYSQIRAVVISSDLGRRKKISELLQNLSSGHLSKIPKPFTSIQIVEFYQNRNLGKDPTNPTLQTKEILKMVLLQPGGNV